MSDDTPLWLFADQLGPDLGALHPLDAVETAGQADRGKSAPLAAVEGLVRQILGWRRR